VFFSDRRCAAIAKPTTTATRNSVPTAYAAVARFTNATRAPIEADNPLATAANPNLG
jgi:hypothetical protein